MKLTLLLLIPGLLFLSCKKGHDLPFTETITKGDKWGIRIGSSAAEVYGQLQTAGARKGFGQVAVVTRPYYDDPKQIEQLLPYYNGLTLMSNAGAIFQVQIAYNDQVTSIFAGGGLPEQVTQWPAEANTETAIHQNDPAADLYEKLAAIHQMPAYNNYQFILPDKPLSKPYDSDMANFDQWALSFSNHVSTSVEGNTSVRLYFKNGKLEKIVHQYNEGMVYN